MANGTRRRRGNSVDATAAAPVDVAGCLGATWIGDGVAGTVDLLRGSTRPGGVMLVGEPYWRREPPDQATVEARHFTSVDDLLPLPELVERFGELGCDVVEMVITDQDGRDRYVAAQWMSIRRWLDANPHDPLADEMRPSSPPLPRATSRTSASTWAGASSP
ncbi:hypothetical protein [Actinophytocola gossypii]|uniref:Uncharacterized protein n=1 Tax=Actinophytocola gossypii TaxID=2812003 RepID=A0ABT2JBX9_9PSEU|nr:hypothetical protein [Actinophytocola gossypii]MCT2585366.1 hypothetical protein [Actinophytocola gossypii]